MYLSYRFIYYISYNRKVVSRFEVQDHKDEEDDDKGAWNNWFVWKRLHVYILNP